MNECEKYNEWFDDYIVGNLSGESLKAFERHLGECQKCKRALEEFRMVVSALKEMPAPSAPDSLRELVQRRIQEQRHLSLFGKLKHFFTFPRLRLLGEVALVVLLLFIGWQIFYSQGWRHQPLREIPPEKSKKEITALTEAPEKLEESIKSRERSVTDTAEAEGILPPHRMTSAKVKPTEKPPIMKKEPVKKPEIRHLLPGTKRTGEKTVSEELRMRAVPKKEESFAPGVATKRFAITEEKEPIPGEQGIPIPETQITRRTHPAPPVKEAKDVLIAPGIPEKSPETTHKVAISPFLTTDTITIKITPIPK